MAKYLIEQFDYKMHRLIVAGWAPSIKGAEVLAQTLDSLMKPDKVSSLRVNVSDGMWALAFLDYQSLLHIYAFSDEEKYWEKASLSASSFSEIIDAVKTTFPGSELKYDALDSSKFFVPGIRLNFETGFVEAAKELYIPGKGKLKNIGVLAVSSNRFALEKIAECWKL